MIREPFQRVPNGSPIDNPCADAAHSVPKIQAVDRLRPAGPDPPERDRDRANTQHEAGSDSIYEVPFKRHKPGFQGDEQSKSPLDSDQGDVQMGLDGFGEESPGVLQVGDRHHRNDASY